ncbi:DUF2064 domain-containing protein [Aureispira sp. CCB-QB1]|uniref:TIGR04282 family arsenosugar biosynthesis glycosyltransferase n=1 Tax=Aureispira sp. CCB-QB1 TaxID=1313421 RepID=UPI000697A66A|nr:DUF2064 domain-containing protein [Aureispira sp. CCB-QB1]
MHQQTAILIFTRTSGAEAKHKLSGDRLSYGTNQKICAELIAKTRRAAQQTSFSVIEINSNQQVGDNLGERLSNSVATVFQAGFNQVLVIGTDTPDISSRLLQNAAQQISTTQATLGASNDGGVYLIGFHRAQFDKTIFANLEWESEAIFEHLKNYFLNRDATIYSTQKLQDIDSFYDLMQFLKSGTNYNFNFRLKQLINSSHTFLPCFQNRLQGTINYYIYHYNRPPPFHV